MSSQSNFKECIVNAFVISRIDYCNSILYGLSTIEHEKLQRVQNIAARLITGSSRRDHITPVLKNLITCIGFLLGRASLIRFYS